MDIILARARASPSFGTATARYSGLNRLSNAEIRASTSGRSSCDGICLSIRPQSPYTTPLFPPHTLYALDIDCPRAVMLTPTTGPLSIRSILVLRSRHCWKGSEWLSVGVHKPSQHRYTGYESVDGAMGRSCRMTSGDDTPGKYLLHCPTLANNLDSLASARVSTSIFIKVSTSTFSSERACKSVPTSMTAAAQRFSPSLPPRMPSSTSSQPVSTSNSS
jgi:hypothetical protein